MTALKLNQPNLAYINPAVLCYDEIDIRISSLFHCLQVAKNLKL